MNFIDISVALGNFVKYQYYFKSIHNIIFKNNFEKKIKKKNLNMVTLKIKL